MTKLISLTNTFKFDNIWWCPGSGTAHVWVFLVNLFFIQLFIPSFVCGITILLLQLNVTVTWICYFWHSCTQIWFSNTKCLSKEIRLSNSGGANFAVRNFLMHIIDFQYYGPFAILGRILQQTLWRLSHLCFSNFFMPSSCHLHLQLSLFSFPFTLPWMIKE